MSKTGPASTVKSGSVIIPIYWAPSKESFLAKWIEGGKEHRRRNKNLDELRKDLRKVARRISDGTVDLASLTPEQSAMCREAVRRGVTLADLDSVTAIEKATVRQAADKFIASKGDASLVYRRTLRGHLDQFCRPFGDRLIASLDTTELDTWLVEVAPGVVTRRNKRQSLVGLWRWCRDKGMLAQEKRTAAERCDCPSLRKERRGHVTETWLPGEMKKILEVVPPAYLPWVALAGFAGVRTNEIFAIGEDKAGLDWRDLKLDGPEPHILMPAGVAKTAHRRKIPICDCLRQWLEPIAKKSGPIAPPVAPWTMSRIWNGKRLTQVIEGATGLPWRKNALRHSFGTYGVIEAGGVGSVALAMGNSERMIKNHYLDVGRTKQEAEEWFAITPNKVNRKLEVVA